MSLFRRKKPGKVFPVKISTMDAELEFSLDYKVTIGVEWKESLTYNLCSGPGSGAV